MEKGMMKFEKEKLQRGKFIAHGSYGAVYEGDYDGKKVAIKLLDFGDNREEESLFKKEASVWSTLNHPNVARFIGATQLKMSPADMKLTNTKKKKNQEQQEKLYWCMVSEFLEGGTLESYLLENRKKKLKLNMVIQLALDIARGLAYLHSQKVVHRDVKTTNMVLDGGGRVKLIDFGVSRKEASNPSEMTGNCGTKLYMAPEVRCCGPYDHKCDVFSFGMCLWEIYHCRVVEILPTSTRPFVHDDCPQKLADLMRRCWLDIGRRPEIDELVKDLEEMSAAAEEEAEAAGANGDLHKKKKFKGCFSFRRRS